MVKHELRLQSYELQVTSYMLRVETLKAQIEIQKREFKSSSWRIITNSITDSKAMKTQLKQTLKTAK